MRHSRQWSEDVRNGTLIAGSAAVAVIATVVLAGGLSAPANRTLRIDPHPARSYEVVEHLSATNRLHGTVTTRSGDIHEGFLRWDRNEASWSDVLDATKLDRGHSALSGIRFGHLDRIVPLGSTQALFHLRSGQTIGMQGASTDLGRPMRALVVDYPGGGQADLKWRDVRHIDFHPAPRNTRPGEGRLHGTLTTGRGVEFTGYIGWDIDEVYTSDILDGEALVQGGEVSYEIPFGAIREIRQYGPIGAHVELHTGERITLYGSNDVDNSNRGITVSDPALGQVTVPWSYFSRLRLHAAEGEESWDDFDGGRPLRGTVTTVTGAEVSGEIRWDQDEYASWEMLNGHNNGLDFAVEFSKIAGIVKNGAGSTVFLRDGRSFDLSGSNDVDGANRGIVVTNGDRARTIPWDIFRELRLDG
jgi:hypothetical protein